MGKNKPEGPTSSAPGAPAVSGEELPVIISFGMYKRGARWVAYAHESQGLRILRAKVLEADPDKSHVTFWLERVRHEFYAYGNSPFDEEVS